MKASLPLRSCDLYTAALSKQDNRVKFSRSRISKSSLEKRMTHTQAHNSLQFEKIKFLEILFSRGVSIPHFSLPRGVPEILSRILIVVDYGPLSELPLYM